MFNPKFTAHETDQNEKILVKAKGFLGETEMFIPITLAEFAEGMQKYTDGAFIHEAFPALTSTHREFLISGMTETQQKAFFG